MLLRTVVDVPLQSAPLGILRGHDPLSGGTELERLRRNFAKSRLQLGREAHVTEHLAGLGRQIREQCFFDGRKRLARALSDRQLTQQLALVPDPRDPVSGVGGQG